MATRFVFFSGKGGVGKTSIACAVAVRHAKKGERILIISTDPAHSLSDCFGKRIGGGIKKVAKNLYASEIDAASCVREYKERILSKMPNPEMFKTMGIELDMASTPGIDEVAAFDKFTQYMNSEEYDLIIFDTAPTGHTLRLLSLPDVLESYLGKLIVFRARIAAVTNLIKRVLPFGEQEETITEDALNEIKERIIKAKELLSSERTSYNIVTIPEEMSIAESERASKAIMKYNIRLEKIIVNQILPANVHCGFCSRRRKIQERGIKKIKKIFRGMDIVFVPLMKEEVRGIKMLEKLAKELHGL